MRPAQQLIRHDPERGHVGDCLRTCMAMCLDLRPEEVPHFVRDTPGEDAREVIRAQREWLRARGQGLLRLWLRMELQEMEDLLDQNPEVPIVVTGESVRGVNHCAVRWQGVWHDPHDLANPTPFIGPAQPSEAWWLEIYTTGAHDV